MFGVDLNYNHKNCLLFDLLFAPSNMLIYDHLFAPGKLLSNFLKYWHFWGASLNLALFIKKDCYYNSNTILRYFGEIVTSKLHPMSPG